MDALKTVAKWFLIILAILLGPIIVVLIGVSLEVLKYLAIGVGILLFPVLIGVAIGMLVKR